MKGRELLREMRLRGMTGAELARRARVSPATVSQAVNNRRVHPRKLQAIVAALAEVEPVPGMARFTAAEG